MYSSYFAFSAGLSLTGKSSLSFFTSGSTRSCGFGGPTFDSSSSSLSSSLEKSPSELTYWFNFSLNGSGDTYLLIFEASSAAVGLLVFIAWASSWVLSEADLDFCVLISALKLSFSCDSSSFVFSNPLTCLVNSANVLWSPSSSWSAILSWMSC